MAISHCIFCWSSGLIFIFLESVEPGEWENTQSQNQIQLLILWPPLMYSMKKEQEENEENEEENKQQEENEEDKGEEERKGYQEVKEQEMDEQEEQEVKEKEEGS